MTAATPGQHEPAPWAQCAAAITRRLTDGRYPHGQLIPDWTALCQELGYGAPATSRALQELQTRQMLTPAGTGYTAGPLKPPAPLPQRAGPHARSPNRKPPAQPPDPAPGPRFLNSEQFITVAEFSAMLRISKMTVYRLIDTGELKAAQFGRAYRIPVSGAKAYLQKSGLDPNQFGL